MKLAIAGIIGRVVIFLGILGFVFALVYTSNNYKFLWFLFLLITVEFIPVYRVETTRLPREEEVTVMKETFEEIE